MSEFDKERKIKQEKLKELGKEGGAGRGRERESG